jgi:hypothetical protein
MLISIIVGFAAVIVALAFFASAAAWATKVDAAPRRSNPPPVVPTNSQGSVTCKSVNPEISNRIQEPAKAST